MTRLSDPPLAVLPKKTILALLSLCAALAGHRALHSPVARADVTPLRASGSCAPSAPIGVLFEAGTGGAVLVSLRPTVEGGEPSIRLQPRGLRARAGQLAWQGAGERVVVFAVPRDGPREVIWEAEMEFAGQIVRDGGSLWIGEGEIPAGTIEGARYGAEYVSIPAVMR